MSSKTSDAVTTDEHDEDCLDGPPEDEAEAAEADADAALADMDEGRDGDDFYDDDPDPGRVEDADQDDDPTIENDAE